MAFVVAAVAGSIVSSAVATWVGGAVLFGAITVGTIVGAVAGFAVTGLITSAFADSPDEQSASARERDRGALINSASSVEPLPRIIGFRRVGGAYFVKDLKEDDPSKLLLGIAVGEGEIQAFDQTLLDGVPSTDPKFAGLVTIEYHTGSDAQAASELLLKGLPSKWTAAHQGKGVAYAVLELKQDATAFAAGLPTVTFDVRGAKLKDVRDGVTRFSPNPALAIRDYWTNARFGRGIAESKMDDATFIGEADYFEGREAVPAHSATFTPDPATDELSFAADEIWDNGDGVTVASTGALPTGLAAATTYYVVRLSERRFQLATTYANAIARTQIDLTSAGSGTLTMSHVDQPRYTANGVVDVELDPSENLRRLRSACRSWLFYSAGKYKLVCDKPAAQSFTMDEDNIVGNWSIDLGGEEGRYNRVTAKFFNPLRSWGPDFAISDNAAERAQDGGAVLEGKLALDFTTNPYMAQRIAQIERRKSRLGLRVEHDLTIQGTKVECGDVIQHTHSTPSWNTKLFRVGKVGLKSNDEVTTYLMEYADSVWTLDAQAATTVPGRTNLPDPSAVGTPGPVSIAEEIYETSGSAGVKSRAIATWNAPGGTFIMSYQLEYKPSPASGWTTLGLVSSPAFVLDDLAPGYYDFRVKGFNIFGAVGDYSPVATREIVGLTAPPAAASQFSLAPMNAQALLTWDRHPDLDVRIGGRILVRWTPRTAGAEWNNTAEIGNFPGDSTQGMTALLAGTYFAKARDSSGNESANAVSVVTTEADLLNFNAVASQVEWPTYSGTKSNCVVVDAKLQLDGALTIDQMTDNIDSWGNIDVTGGVAAQGLYDFSTYVDLGAVYKSRVRAFYKTTSFDADNLIDSMLEPIDSWGLVDGPQISSTNVNLFIATTNDDPAGAPTWSAWRPFQIGDYTARAFKFRLELLSANRNHNIQVEELSVQVDMPDREDGARNVASGAGTKSVVYTLSPVFKVLPKIGVTAKNMGTGDYFTIANEATTGFDITFRNSAAAAVDRTFDWRAISY